MPAAFARRSLFERVQGRRLFDFRYPFHVFEMGVFGNRGDETVAIMASELHVFLETPRPVYFK